METPLAFSSSMISTEDLDLGLAQRRGRLVHDEYGCVFDEGLRDLDYLLLPYFEVPDEGPRRDILLEPEHQLGGFAFLEGMVDPSGALHLLAVGEKVLGDAHVREEVHLLVDDADAVS